MCGAIRPMKFKIPMNAVVTAAVSEQTIMLLTISAPVLTPSDFAALSPLKSAV